MLAWPGVVTLRLKLSWVLVMVLAAATSEPVMVNPLIVSVPVPTVTLAVVPAASNAKVVLLIAPVLAPQCLDQAAGPGAQDPSSRRSVLWQPRRPDARFPFPASDGHLSLWQTGR
jgi:hypothetical protein